MGVLWRRRAAPGAARCFGPRGALGSHSLPDGGWPPGPRARRPAAGSPRAPSSRALRAGVEALWNDCRAWGGNCRLGLLQHILPCPPSAVALRVALFSLVIAGKGPCGISATEPAGTRRSVVRRLGLGSLGNAPWPARGHPLLSPFCGSGSPLAVNPMRGSPSRAAR